MSARERGKREKNTRNDRTPRSARKAMEGKDRRVEVKECSRRAPDAPRGRRTVAVASEQSGKQPR